LAFDGRCVLDCHVEVLSRQRPGRRE
jgi:hypothetical protein